MRTLVLLIICAQTICGQVFLPKAQNNISTTGLSCLINTCQNGGICYRVNEEKPEGRYCADGSALYSDFCYKVHPERKTWAQASSICSQNGGALASVRDAAERIFLEGFARQQNITGQPHIWTGAVANQSSDFLWAGTSSSVNLTLFQVETSRVPRQVPYPEDALPSKSPSADRVLCLALDGMSNYATWIKTSCSKVKYPFICTEKPKLLNDLSGSPPQQCQCGLKYEGLFCEKKLDTGVLSYGTGLKCANDVVSLSCPSEPQELRIEIEYAMYGSIINKENVCASHSTGEMANFDSSCAVPSALNYLKENCQGRKDCTVKMSMVDLQDPCPDTPRQLQYRYRCVDKAGSCGTNQFFLENACYEVYNKFKATWNEARMFCQLYNGQLPSVSSPKAEAIIKEAAKTEADSAFRKQSQFNGEQNAQLWLSYRNFDSEDLDDPGKTAASQGEQNTTLWTKKSRRKRDEQNQCVSIGITKTHFVKDTTVSWKVVDCRKKLGWICQFPTFSLASSIPLTGANLSVHSRSVEPSSNQYQSTGPIFFSTVIPPLNFTIPSITPIPSIPWFTQKFVFPTKPGSEADPFTKSPGFLIGNGSELPFTFATREPSVGFGERFCEEKSVEGHVWQKARPGTFVIHECENAKDWTKQLKDETVSNVRHIVETLAPEMQNLFDANVGKYPSGFTFWMCVKTISGEQYLPAPGPVTILCAEGERMNPPSVAAPLPLASTAEGFANYTLTSRLNGTEILSAVNFLETMLSEKQRQSKAAPRTMDFESPVSTDAFVGDITRSVSNMLMDIHKPGWSELSNDQRSTAATTLMKATEDSVAMLATVDSTQPVASYEKRLQYENIAVQVVVLQAQSSTSRLVNDEPVIFSPSSGDGVGTNRMDVDAATNSIVLPPSVRSFNDSAGNVRISFVQYSETLSYLLSTIDASQNGSDAKKQVVNTKILSATVLDKNQLRRSVNLGDEAVTLVFGNSNQNGSSPTCVFWNMDDTLRPFWDPSGCNMTLFNSTHTICQCSHLTNFAVLMDLNGALASLDAKDRLALNVISYVGCVISIVCLILCLIIFTFFRQLWCDRVTIHRNLTFCLLIAQFVFVLGVDRVHNQIGCAITAGILHYTLLAAFSWMLLEGLQLYMMLVQVFESEESRKVWYYAFGYGLPGIIVAVAAGIRPDHYGAEKYCWLNPADGFVWSFAGPVLVIVLINTGFLVTALLKVFKVRNPARQQNSLGKVRGWLRGSVMLLCLLGTTWLFGFLYLGNSATLVFAYLFTICNSLQGLFIFIFHCCMNEKVFATVQRYIRRCSWCPQWCKDCIGEPKTTKTSSSGKENNSNAHHGSLVWNILKLRRLSHESSLSSQSAIAKQLSTDSDYFSKSSSLKSSKSRKHRPALSKDNSLDFPDIKEESPYRKPGRHNSVSDNSNGREPAPTYHGFSNPAFSQDNLFSNTSRL